jgi:hypothetical protein
MTIRITVPEKEEKDLIRWAKAREIDPADMGVKIFCQGMSRHRALDNYQEGKGSKPRKPKAAKSAKAKTAKAKPKAKARSSKPKAKAGIVKSKTNGNGAHPVTPAQESAAATSE